MVALLSIISEPSIQLGTAVKCHRRINSLAKKGNDDDLYWQEKCFRFLTSFQFGTVQSFLRESKAFNANAMLKFSLSLAIQTTLSIAFTYLSVGCS